MKIAIIGPSPRFLSGISYYTTRLSNALSESGVEVESLLFRHMLPKRLFPGWKRVGSALSALHYASRVQVHEFLDWYNPLSWAGGYQKIRNADIIILEWWTSSVAHMYLALLVLNRGNIPVIIEFHEVVDPFEHSILPIRLYSKIMALIIRKKADRYLVHSEHDRGLIASQYRIDPAKILVVAHGLYDQYPVFPAQESREKLGIRAGKVILFFGLIRPYKGVAVLIRAFEALGPAARDMTLVIAGETWEDQESLALINRSAVRDRILLVNRYISDEEIPLFFSAADMLVLPYLRASQSGVAHIGIAYGLPIIASRVGGLVESLGSYEGTTFVDPGMEQDLSQSILNLGGTMKITYPVPELMQWHHIAERIIDWAQVTEKI